MLSNKATTAMQTHATTATQVFGCMTLLLLEDHDPPASSIAEQPGVELVHGSEVSDAGKLLVVAVPEELIGVTAFSPRPDYSLRSASIREADGASCSNPQTTRPALSIRKHVGH